MQTIILKKDNGIKQQQKGRYSIIYSEKVQVKTLTFEKFLPWN